MRPTTHHAVLAPKSVEGGSRITHHASRITDHAFSVTRHPSPVTRHSGVALVITLILLSVITFMAVTFLVVSRSEHGSVDTTIDATTARLAKDTGFEAAKLRLLAPMLAFTNQYNFPSLMV